MTQDKIIEMARQVARQPNRIYAPDEKEFLYYFAKMVEKQKLNEVAAACERLPFGDTAQSFAVWIRQQ